jgi:hypothetical protein
MSDMIEAIKRILCDDWKPLGRGMPKDEYDSYVPVCHFILCSNIPNKCNQLTSYLHGVEEHSLGLTAKYNKGLLENHEAMINPDISIAVRYLLLLIESQ